MARSSCALKRSFAFGIVAALCCLAAGASAAVSIPLCDGFWLSSGSSFDVVASAWQERAPDSCAFVVNPSFSTQGKGIESLTGTLTTNGHPRVFDAVTSRGNFTALLSEDGTSLVFWAKPVTSGVAQHPKYTWLRVAAPSVGPNAPELNGQFKSGDGLVKLACATPVTARSVSECRLQVADGSKYKIPTSPLVAAQVSNIQQNNWWTATTFDGDQLSLQLVDGMVMIWSKPDEPITGALLAVLYRTEA